MTDKDYQKGKDGRPIALEARESAQEDARLFSPSTARNRDVLRDVFLAHVCTKGRVLEIGCGTGEHGAHITEAAPGVHWTPSDPDPASRASAEAWRVFSGRANIAAPLAIDVREDHWPGADGPFDAVVSVNMIHIAPIEAAEGLIAGAARRLVPGGKLFLYGPFSRNGAHTAPSNAQFDENLKMRDARWGVRDLEADIIPRAADAGISFVEAVPMPANNFSVIFRRD